ncbi:MAG: hypothetical protein NUV78_00760 [Candidatus Zambryskibacteria bacterium]|nr:hypothetical protein [Candidatus Zambryskibacteria bacterium]
MDPIELLLYGTDAQRRAIKLVDLFEYLVPHVAVANALDSVNLRLKEFHGEFPCFVSQLSLRTNSEENVLLGIDAEGLCPAVTLHTEAYASMSSRMPGFRELARMFYCHDKERFQPRELIMKRAEEVGVFVGVLSWDHLMNSVQGSLTRLGALKK